MSFKLINISFSYLFIYKGKFVILQFVLFKIY